MLDRWLTPDADNRNRADDAWERIQARPESIVLRRGDDLLDAQTARVEIGRTANERDSGMGQGSYADVVVFGVRGHTTQPDLDIRRGDTFALNGALYRVMDVALMPGEVQARCEVQS